MAVVLLVDDSKTMRLVLRKHLEGMGLDFLEAENGRGALDLLRGQQRIEVVISDVRMDDIDGLELVRSIREREDFGTRVGVILISGDSSVNVRAGSYLAGADEFLAKPVDPRTLQRVVGELLDTASSAGR